MMKSNLVANINDSAGQDSINIEAGRIHHSLLTIDHLIVSLLL